MNNENFLGHTDATDDTDFIIQTRLQCHTLHL